MRKSSWRLSSTQLSSLTREKGGFRFWAPTSMISCCTAPIMDLMVSIFSQFQSVIRYQFGILSLICCPCLGSQLWVPGTQLGRKVPGISCCARSPRVRGQPMMEDQQLPSLARAAEAGSRGSTSHSASKSPPIEEFTIIEMTQRLDGNNSFAFILFTHSVLFQSVTIAEVWISPGVTASCLRYS